MEVSMSALTTILVRHPQPYDLVDDPVSMSGIATAFEASVSARLRDSNGAELNRTHFMAGGNGVFANFHHTIAMNAVPGTSLGTLEVFEESAKDGSEINKVVIPVIYGRALVDPYHGFSLYTVVAGDTLSAIAQQLYGDGSLWPRLFEANRNQIADPNLIFPGQVLRVPQ
jgi:nucleoid-associated protein YgaU